MNTIIRLSLAAIVFGSALFTAIGCGADTAQGGPPPKNAAQGAEGAKANLSPTAAGGGAATQATTQ